MQAEGTVLGKPFYFRARGNHWQMNIGGCDVVCSPEWLYSQGYGDVPYAAGWMGIEEAEEFIRIAADKYLEQNSNADKT